MDFAVPADHEVKIKENEKKDKYVNLDKEPKRLSNSDTICNWYPWNGPKRQRKRGWKGWKLKDESRISKQWHCWDRPEYWK